MSQSFSQDNFSTLQMRSSISFQDSAELNGRSRKLPHDMMSKSFLLETVPETEAADTDSLTRPTFLNLAGPAPATAVKRLQKPASMSTLHEERSASKDSDEEEKEKETSRECRVEVKQNKLTTSHTCESLNESQPKTSTGTPSLVSSGYGSQAASTSNLSSEDSISIKSISVDETPETEACKAIPQSLALPSVLSPPDVSVSSISPGEDTDHTMTETTPSSANITPSHSVELSQESQSDHQVV